MMIGMTIRINNALIQEAKDQLKLIAENKINVIDEIKFQEMEIAERHFEKFLSLIKVNNTEITTHILVDLSDTDFILFKPELGRIQSKPVDQPFKPKSVK